MYAGIHIWPQILNSMWEFGMCLPSLHNINVLISDMTFCSQAMSTPGVSSYTYVNHLKNC